MNLAVWVAVLAALAGGPGAARIPLDARSAGAVLARAPVTLNSLVNINGERCRVTLDESRGIVLSHRDHGRRTEVVLPLVAPLRRTGNVIFCRTKYGPVTLTERRANGSRAFGRPGSPPLPFSGEFLIDRYFARGPAEDYQYFPAVASDGTDYLVVWFDEEVNGLIGARVLADGTLGPEGPITIAPDIEEPEATPFPVVFDGTNYWVFWPQYTEGPTELDIVGARISPEGELLDPEPLPVFAVEEDEPWVVNACAGGASVLVVWNSEVGTMGARVSPDGTVLDPAGFLVTDGIWIEECSDLTSDGTNWLLAGVHIGQVAVVLIGPAGNVLNATPIPVTVGAEPLGWMSATYGAGCYFITWDNLSGGLRDICGVRVDPTGAPLDPAFIVVHTDAEFQCCPTTCFDGTNFLVAWFDGRDGYYPWAAARVSPADGSVLDPDGIALSSEEEETEEWPGGELCRGSGNCLFVRGSEYADLTNDWDILGTRIASDATPLDDPPIIISLGGVGSYEVSSASDGENYLGVWWSEREGTNHIFASRVSASGSVLDPQGIDVGRMGWRCGIPDPVQVVFDGANWVVAWVDNGDVLHPTVSCARISQAGVLLDPAGIVVAVADAPYAFNVVGLATDNTNTMVVWEEYAALRGARVSQAGVLLDPAGINIVTSLSGDLSAGSFLFGGGNYFLVWTEWADHGSGWNDDLRCTRISPSGTVLDPAGIDVAVGEGDARVPLACYDGTNYVLAFYYSGPPDYFSLVYAARVTPAGAVLDPGGFRVCNFLSFQYPLAICAGSGASLLTWLDDRNGLSLELYCGRVSTAGVALDPAGIRLARQESWLWWEPIGSVFDGANWLQVWGNGRTDAVAGVRVSSAGVRLDSFALAIGTQAQFRGLTRGPGNQSLVTFLAWTDAWGGQPVAATKAWGKLYGSSGVASGWEARAPYPDPSLKPVSAGAFLADGPNTIFGARGNKTFDFYSYRTGTNLWTEMRDVPAGDNNKPVSKGGAGIGDGAAWVYAVKGNNTLEAYRYKTEKDSWYRLPDVTAGAHRIKGGSDLAYVVMRDSGYAYLLKGYKNEFYRYNVTRSIWETLENAPTTGGPKYDKGSFLAYDGSGLIYAHQAKYNKLFAYDLGTGHWRTAPELHGIPFDSPRTGKHSKKVKEGGCGVWFDGHIFALKGGNTQEFWRYDPDGDTWHELDTMPQTAPGNTKRKKVKGGADITEYTGRLYAFKGNKTYEFWRYNFGGGTDAGGRDGVMASRLQTLDSRLQIAPNPLVSGFAVLHWNPRILDPSTPASLSLYDAVGRCVLTRTLEPLNPRTLSLDLRALANGVYLVRVTGAGGTASQKLVVER